MSRDPITGIATDDKKHVQHHAIDIIQVFADVRACLSRERVHQRQGLEERRDAGERLFALKQVIATGEWLAELEKNHIDARWARDSIRIYCNWERAEPLLERGSMREMMELVRQLEKEETEQQQGEPGEDREEDNSAPTKEGNGSAPETGPAKGKSRKTAFCERCLRVGVTKGCEACAELNRKPPKTVISGGSGSAKPPKSGEQTVDLKSILDGLGRAIRGSDEIAKVLPELKKEPLFKAYQEAAKVMAEAWAEWKKAFEKHMKEKS